MKQRSFPPAADLPRGSPRCQNECHEQGWNRIPNKSSPSSRKPAASADAAANFVFMTMILFQTNFYTDVFGLSAPPRRQSCSGPKLWDACFDPIMGVLADRPALVGGSLGPWVIWTALPWAVVMVLAYTTPKGWSYAALLAYAAITNTLLMTLYSMNNMPYSALGGVMTADLTNAPGSIPTGSSQ